MEGLIVLGVALFAVVLFFYYVPVGLFLTALFSGTYVGIGSLIGMRLRGIPPSLIVDNFIKATKSGLKISVSDLQTHYMARGNVNNVVNALISADKANLGLDFKMATSIDLAGRDVLEAVHDSVNPKVIESSAVTAVAKDGIQLIVKSRVTVRANIAKLVGGAGEQTILARIGEGIVSTIGSADSHKSVMESPDKISKVVLDKGLDSGTAYSIISIDIADIDIGANVGAKLMADQAEAELKVARAKAEERRAMAVAEEQEFVAKAQEMRAKVIEAEAKVPEAMAEAFRAGNMGIMDFYRMKNLQSDTAMRDQIAKGGQ
jgi:uncharacterized protein YqfA (UPF0365 family)